MQSSTCWQNELKWIYFLNFHIWVGGGGGRGRGVAINRFPFPVLPPPVLFCPFVSRLPPFIVFLPLSCKSSCLTPYSNRECFGLVKNKKLCCKSNHFALSSAIIEAAFLRLKLTPRSKILNVLWTTVLRSELLGRIFPTTSKNTETDRSKWSLTTFYLTRFVVLTENFDS